jgi:hypothetical protein
VTAIKHIVHSLLRWLAGFAAGLALAAAFLVWRLSSGPVSLDALTPYVDRALAGTEAGVSVEVEQTQLRLRDGAAAVDIVARGVHLSRQNGEARLTLPAVSLGLSLRAALRGVLAPTHIALERPELHLTRAADGSFRLGLEGDEAAGGADWAQVLLHDVAAPPDRRGPLGYLTRVALRDAEVVVDDRALGVTWRAHHADASLVRDAAGSFGDIAFSVAQPDGGEATLRGGFHFAAASNGLTVQLGFGALRPALYAAAAPGLAPLGVLALPVGGEVQVELDTARLAIRDAWCVLTLGAGRLEHAALAGGSVAVAAGELGARYDPTAGRVRLDRLTVDLGGPKVSLTGTVDGLGSGVLAGALPQTIDLAGVLRLAGVPVDDLPRLWPAQLSPRTRAWVTEHVHDGVVDEVVTHLGVHVDFAADAVKPVDLRTMEGTFAYHGLTIAYFPPLEPLRGVDGTASFDRAHLDLMPSAGAVKAVHLAGGAAKLGKLDTDDEEINIDLGLRGPLRDVLDVLDTKPLQYAHELKLDPAGVAGAVDGQVHFAFPLKHDLTLDLVDYGARAQLSGVTLERAAAGHDLTQGELQLRLDRSAVKLDGTAALAEVPASLSWMYSLKAKSQTRARYAVKARLDDAARRRLALDFVADMLKGPVDVDLTYTLLALNRATAALSLDLKEASLAVAKLNWEKPAKVPAVAKLDLDLIDDQIRAVRQATLSGDRLDVRLAASLEGGRVLRVEVPRLVLGETDAGGSVARRAEGGWRVELKGLSFDATALMTGVDRPAETEQRDPPLVIDAAVDRLVLGPKREARNVTGQFYSDGLHWQAMSVDATMLGGGKMSVRFGEAAGDRTFRLTADDFGALLRLFDVSEHVAGGQLEVTGQVEDTGPRRLFRGKVSGADYRIVGAPVFARLLSVASLSGIGALLSGEGIPFTRLKGDVTLADAKLEVKELRAYGGAIGVNAAGVYDLADESLDVSGTLVPAYTINTVLGNIPVLGKILLGGEGQGIFAANFRVAGATSDAKITVNPLSALAPGFLRRLFLFDAPKPAPTTSAQKPQ